MDPVTPSPRLVELAHAHGVATEYWDWQGQHVTVTAPAITAVLTALGVDSDGDEQVERALTEVDLAPWRRTLPSTVVAREGWTPWVFAHVPPGTGIRLTVHLEETMAIELCRWHPQLSVTALRFSNVMDVEDYAEFPSFDADAALRRWNLWGYIDGRDGAQAVEKSLAYTVPGFDCFIIASPDTVMSRSNADLVAEQFPGVEVRGDLGEHDTLLSIDKARRILGYDPQHSWRGEV